MRNNRFYSVIYMNRIWIQTNSIEREVTASGEKSPQAKKINAYREFKWNL